MQQLLLNYSLPNILIFTVVLALAIKGLLSFYDWGYERLKRIFDKEHTELYEKEKLQKRLQKGSQIMEDLETDQKENERALEELSGKIDMLIDSDRDAIKSFITKEHHYFCYQLGWIDSFSLDCLERRYQHYKAENGNSFIDNFMKELRELPKDNPWET